MAEMVERKICHPSEVILKKGDFAEFMILQKGKVNFCCNTNKNNSLNNKVVVKIIVGENEKAKLLSLDFIKNRILKYDIVSNDYSILYTLSEENIKEALKSSKVDYELFCLIKDREEYVMDELNIYPYELCKDKFHNKFDCPKIHFYPLRQMVIYKNIMKGKTSKFKRIPFQRQKSSYSCLLLPCLYRQYEKFEREYLATYAQDESEKQSKQFREVKFNQLELRRNRGQGTLIADRIEKFLNHNMLEKNFWDLETDKAHNFSFYFKHQNSEKLCKQRIGKYRPSYFYIRQ